MLIPKLNKYTLDFPNPTQANEDGIVAWGGDLNPSRLLQAYRNGIFPWYSHPDPILWWSPNPRLIMELDDFNFRKSLKKNMKKFTFKFDTNFKTVMHRCGSIQRENQNGTWIQNDLIESFEVLHGMGIAHSVETYKDGKLVGGLYGLVIGKIFCGESMFSEVTDSSKAAYAILVFHLKKWGFDFIDAQVPTKHLKSLGAIEISREIYLKRLNNLKDEDTVEKWEIDPNILNL